MDFSEKCYKVLKKVPRGKVVTYKSIAKKLNSHAYRAVGNSMNKNLNPISVPCHRVVNSNGEIGGYAFGVKNKIKILKKEGVEIRNGKIDLNRYEFKL